MPDGSLAEAANTIGTVVGGAGTVGAAAEGIAVAKSVTDQLPGEIGKTSRKFKIPFIGRKSEPPKTPNEKPKSLTQNELIEGGSSKVEVRIDSKTMGQLLDRLRRKAQNARRIQDRPGGELSIVDQYLLRSDVLQRLKDGQLSQEDYITALVDINDELAQKASVAGKLVSETKGSIIRHVPIVGIIAARPETRFKNVPGVPISESSYTKEVGYVPTEAELIQLNDLRIKLNEAAFGKGFRDPLFDQINTSIYPQALLNQSRHDVYREISKQIENVIADRVKAGTLGAGENPQHLWSSDKTEMARVMMEANQRALAQLTLDGALRVIKTPPEISRQAITDRATEIRKPPTREELTTLLDAKTKAEAELTEAQTKYDTLKTEYDRLRLARKTKELTQNAVRDFNTTYVTAGGFGNLEARIAGYDTTLASASDDATRLRISELKAREVTELNRLRSEQYILFREFATAESEYGPDESSRLTTMGTPTQGATAATGEFGPLAADLETKKSEAKTATENHDTRSRALDAGILPKDKQRADDLDEWGTVVDRYGTVMDTQRKQKTGDDYTLDKLSDPALTTQGQVDGAERIRESIFFVANPSKSDPEQARRILSDDAIAKGIIHIYELPIDTTIGSSGRTLNQIGRSMDICQQELYRLNSMPDTHPNRDADIATNSQRLNEDRLELIQSTVSQISRTDRFRAFRLISFLATEGAKSAQKGNPYLNIDRDYYIR